MRLNEATGLVELMDCELEQVNGAGLPPSGMSFENLGKGGELHARVSGPPLAGEIGGSYTGPGGTIGGSIATDGQNWTLGLGGALTSASGRTSVAGSAHSDGHDWSVTASCVLRF